MINVIVNGISRRSWHVAHNGSLFTEELIQQARLPNVRSPHNGDRNFALTSRDATLRREPTQAFNKHVKEIA